MKIKLSKSQWEAVGRKAGWIRLSDSKEYEEGKKARREGKTEVDNPYPDGSRQSTQWHYGWNEVDFLMHDEIRKLYEEIISKINQLGYKDLVGLREIVKREFSGKEISRPHAY